MTTGYFGIGIENAKTEYNVGGLWRSAQILGASFIFTIGRRYEKQSTDTTKTWRNIPLFKYDTFEQFYANIPYSCFLVGVELTEKATEIERFWHPQRAIYLLGPEDGSISPAAQSKCQSMIKLPGTPCYNVAVAGSLIMFHRKLQKNKEFR